MRDGAERSISRKILVSGSGDGAAVARLLHRKTGLRDIRVARTICMSGHARGRPQRVGSLAEFGHEPMEA